MRRITYSKSTMTVFITMIAIVILALTASVMLAAMSTSNHAKNTVYIASLGEIKCTASAPAKLYPGGTSDGTISFALTSGKNLVDSVEITDFKLTSFTLKWGDKTGQSATFNTGITNSTNSATVKTTAGNWVFALNLGSGLSVSVGTPQDCTISVTVPLGFDNSESYDSVKGGSSTDGYLVGNVTSVDFEFTVTVEPTSALQSS